MKKLFTRAALLAIFSVISFLSSAQVDQKYEYDDELFLPKYPTASERSYMDQKAAALIEEMRNRGPLSQAQREAGTCEGSCGGQSAPGSCWCDNLCATYGDCCDDYAEFCLDTPPPGPPPTNHIVPGEFEESQSIALRWPYTTNTSTRTKLYAELISAIQQEVPVWIFINNGGDSTTVKNALNFHGVTLQNYEFMIKSTNSIWTRDYGPWGYYYGEDDELGFIDMQYYTSRPLDNQVPSWLANKIGIPVYTTPMYEEGGNLMVDGFGHAFHGTGIFTKNQSQNGWSFQLTRDTHQELFNTVQATEAERLLCDGGTGHIDMYAKLLDEQTLLVSEYPSVVVASDRQRIEDNVALFAAQSNTFGGGFDIVRVPMPRRDDGTYSTSCTQINADARGFVNGLFVNKTFIVPIYTDASSSQFNRDWDEAALELIRKAMPGYNVVGIDSRSLTTSGGAIHCVTMQIPTDNPVRFRHERLVGLQPALPAYSITAEIRNKSGISSASLFWKVKSASTWNEVAMNANGNNYDALIANSGFTTADTIVYYLQATTNNGKTMAKPIVAPEGSFTFYFDDVVVTPGNCEAPAGLFVSNIGTSTATLNWTPVADANTYTIRGTLQGGSNFQTVTVNNGNAASINVNILNPGLNYQWEIRTSCTNGEESDWSAVSLFSTDPCVTPTGLSATNITATSATLSWSAVPGAFGYQVRGRPLGGAGYQLFNVNANSTSLNTGNQLMANTNYEWSVRTYCNSQKTITSPWATNVVFGTALPPGIVAQGGSDEALGMELFPNPSDGQVYVTVKGTEEHFVLIIRDITGREVFKKQYPAASGLIEVQLGNVSKGVYLVQLHAENTQLVQRLVIR